MAQFRGLVQGQRGEATRLGTKSSGLRVDAAGWGGRITIGLFHNEETGEDDFRIAQETHSGAGIYELIATGTLGKPAKRENNNET